jgi:SWI/SNF-related matrix-associated actin-dependent regulator of chromatin subfamily A member 5
MPPQLEEDAQALSQALADVEEPSSSVALKTPPADIRRSGRERSSTVIHVDGHVVKKQNFYQVKGHEYVYGTIEGHHAAPKPKSIPVFHGPKPAPKPRVATAQELDRRSRKLSTERLIQEKLAARQSFLKENLTAMAPFLEPKIVTKVDGFSAKVREDDFLAAKPQSIIADLRDYQLEGLQWMASMYRKNMGIILGDEMGLGKTLQSIALICHIKEKYGRTGPSLVVCPLSVLYSWCAEIEKWAPSLKFLRFHGSNVESMDFPNLSAYDIVVTTYEMVKVPKLRNLIWARNYFNLLILDEGQRIKGADTHIAKAVRLIHCESRVILTGTVLSNNLVELWSLLNFLVPDVFTVQEPFVDAFDLSQNRVDKEKLKNAYKLLKIFMLRRLKAEVEKLMPKKVETKVICPLSRDQIWWYKAVLMKDIGLLAASERSVGGNKGKVLSNLVMQLRKVCLHPGLFMKDDPAVDETVEELVGASGKLTVLDKLLRSLYQKGHRVVLFSQFTSVLDILEDYCAMRGWDHCRFDGSTARARRNYVVQSFNKAESSKFIFLMSTRSGGVGLNLQTADTVVLFDSDWNPQPDIQAMARVHR